MLNFDAIVLEQGDMQELDDDFTKYELRAAVFELHPEKAPDPYGYTGLFYRKCWDLVHVCHSAAVSRFDLDRRSGSKYAKLR